MSKLFDGSRGVVAQDQTVNPYGMVGSLGVIDWEGGKGALELWVGSGGVIDGENWVKAQFNLGGPDHDLGAVIDASNDSAFVTFELPPCTIDLAAWCQTNQMTGLNAVAYKL